MSTRQPLSVVRTRKGRGQTALSVVGALVVVLVSATGCGGGPPADLFLVERSGTIPGARLTLRVTDDGQVSCNGAALVAITSADLIDARQARRDLEGGDDPEADGPADRGLSLPPGSGSILRYRVRAEAGTVRWADTSPRQPQVFSELAALTRRIAKGSCGLAR